jgi:hypothetical protein
MHGKVENTETTICTKKSIQPRAVVPDNFTQQCPSLANACMQVTIQAAAPINFNPSDARGCLT